MKDRRTLPSSRIATAVGLAVLPAAALVVQLASPDRLLDGVYARSLERTDAAWVSPADSPLLNRTSLSAAPRRKPFAVGDRMVIETRGGTPEAITITGLEQIDGGTLGLDGVAFQMVTARAERDPAGETLRFLFAIEQPGGPALPRPGRAL
jgi:hypothetical protein